MIAVAAIDLMDGMAVQLIQGNPESVQVSDPDPVAIARSWELAGFPRLHVVDLDAALGRGDNSAVVARIIASVDVPVQVGGGIRDRDAARRWLERGADRILVGTRAVREADWCAALAAERPGRLIVAADVRGDEVVTHGWTSGSGRGLAELLAVYEDTPLAAVLVTDVRREGRLRGADRDLFARAVAATRHPLIAAGGIATADDLAPLARVGVAEVVLGMSLYTGGITPDALDPWLTAEDRGGSSQQEDTG